MFQFIVNGVIGKLGSVQSHAAMEFEQTRGQRMSKNPTVEHASVRIQPLKVVISRTALVCMFYSLMSILFNMCVRNYTCTRYTINELCGFLISWGNQTQWLVLKEKVWYTQVFRYVEYRALTLKPWRVHLLANKSV